MNNLLILPVLLLIFSILEITEASSVAVNDNQLEKLASGGNTKAARLKKLLDTPTRFIGAVHTAQALTASLLAVLSGIWLIPLMHTAFSDKLGNNAAFAVSAFLTALAVMSAALVFGRFIPRGIAGKEPEKAALRLCRTALIVTVIFAPVSALLSLISDGILRLFGIDPKAADNAVTEEEILMMSDAGAEKGTIDEDENRIIKNVFAFDDLTADQVCTHRPDVSVLWSKDKTEVWEETIHRTRHSFFPVCGESVDKIIGVLDAKDYFRLEDKSRENIMKNAVSEPCFVHESLKADRLLEQMKQKGADHFAVVVDEYGGMTGIITITDLIEELVGDFADGSSDTPAQRFEKISSNIWNVPGITLLSEINSELETELPDETYDTFGGYVVAKLGRIPKNGTQPILDSDGLHIEVLEVKHHRIELCRVTMTKPLEDEDE